jgi:hypothetical protein
MEIDVVEGVEENSQECLDAERSIETLEVGNIKLTDLTQRSRIAPYSWRGNISRFYTLHG